MPAKSLGLQEKILLTGGMLPEDPRLIGLFERAEALLLPSLSETFGLVILEAWATGTMVVSTRTSGAAGLVRDGENGWFFDLDRPHTFHEAVEQTLGRSETTRAVLAHGAEEVSRNYNLSVLAGRMKDLYNELIEEKQCAT